LGSLNSDWENDDKISPLVLYVKRDPKLCLIEFSFVPDCYERKLDKTILKENWSVILKNTYFF